MATDNRTTLNDCSSNASWTGDDAATADTDAGSSYEGGTALSTQMSNADEHMYTTAIGGTRDLSASTVFMLIKDNLVSTKVLGGIKVVLHDGTNRIGYEVGGNDDTGLPLPTFFNSYKLDVSNSSAVTGHVFAGVEANLAEASITGVGYGTIHLAKANGALDNAWMDRFCFHTNTSYAMTVDAGTVGTPDTFALVAADDIAGGFGMIANPKGKQYDLFASTEFGDDTAADSYFVDSDFQLFLIGSDLGAGNFIFRTVAHASQFHQLRWTNASVVCVGTRAVIDFSDANFDDLQFTNVSFTGAGAITFPATNTALRFLSACAFNDCDLLDFGDTDATGIAINGTTRANGALVLDENVTYVESLVDFTFTSDGTGHAYEIAPVGAGPFTYDIAGWTSDGFTGAPGALGTSGDEVLFINPATLSADITLNLSGGGESPSYQVVGSYTGTVTINNNVQVTLTGLRDNTEVRVYNQDADPVELAGIEDATAGTTDDRSFAFSLGAGVVVDIAIFNVDYIFPPNNRVESYTIPVADTSLPITQVFDRNFSNP